MKSQNLISKMNEFLNELFKYVPQMGILTVSGDDTPEGSRTFALNRKGAEVVIGEGRGEEQNLRASLLSSICGVTLRTVSGDETQRFVNEAGREQPFFEVRGFLTQCLPQSEIFIWEQLKKDEVVLCYCADASTGKRIEPERGVKYLGLDEEENIEEFPEIIED